MKGGWDAFVAWRESSYSPGGRPLSPTGSADVICQTKTYIYTESRDEIRGPKAGLSAAIRGEEPSQLSFSFSPCVPQSCCSVSLQQICVMTSEGDWGLATVAQRRLNRKPNWWLSQVNYIANFHIFLYYYCIWNSVSCNRYKQHVSFLSSFCLCWSCKDAYRLQIYRLSVYKKKNVAILLFFHDYLVVRGTWGAQ